MWRAANSFVHTNIARSIGLQHEKKGEEEEEDGGGKTNERINRWTIYRCYLPFPVECVSVCRARVETDRCAVDFPCFAASDAQMTEALAKFIDTLRHHYVARGFRSRSSPM